MLNKAYNYCQIYVKSESFDQLQDTLVAIFGGTFEVRTMHLRDCSIDARRNPRGNDTIDEFVQWPFLVEFDADEGYPQEASVATVVRILNGLWENDLQAVAACDFEDELPWNGGTSRL